MEAGQKLGPYEIIARVGAGGMGEVYRAKDTRLDRVVAIKILASSSSHTSDAKARFEREAKAISSLSHPNICTLFDIGHQDGTDFLVMEFLEGQTLSERIAKGALPNDQVLRFGIQIAEALERAHRQGIVHRDLKPGNIMLTKSGAKIVDFGLARLMKTLETSGAEASAFATASAAITADGTIPGTVQYMAPEQLEGKEADARTDIFAFGLVLYEMATGRKAFTGTSKASLISNILTSEPLPISNMQPMAPPVLDRVVKTCLAKDPDERWQTAHDVLIELKWIADGVSHPVASSQSPAQRKGRETLAWLLAGTFLAALIAIGPFVAKHFREPQIPGQEVRFEVNAPANSEFGNSLAISPDGRLLVFVANTHGKDVLWIRPLDSLESRQLPGTDGAILPFWSPDSRFIGFFAEGALKKMDITAGTPQTLASASIQPRGATWGTRGIILYSSGPGTPLFQIRDTGGKPSAATALNQSRNESSHRWPFFLPDGVHFLYLVQGAEVERPDIYVGSLDSTDVKRIATATSACVYSRSGHLLFKLDRTLMGQRFSISNLQVEGEPFRVKESVESISQSGPTGFLPMSISDNGTLVYKKYANAQSQLAWHDRIGKQLQSIGPAGILDEPALSLNEKHIAVNFEDPKTEKRNVWLLDTGRGTLSRFTFRPDAASPVWSPDGSKLVYASISKSGYPNLYQQSTNGSDEEELVLESSRAKWPTDWSRDGSIVVFETDDQQSNSDLWLLSMKGERKATPFLNREYYESQGQISPDGRWFAYSSGETGQSEVYVVAFTSKKDKLQISDGGGSMPAWRDDGKELYYISADNNLMAVAVDGTTDFQAGIAKPLFKTKFRRSEVGWNRQYAPSKDGQRFLLNSVSTDTLQSPIKVVINWAATLK